MKTQKKIYFITAGIPLVFLAVFYFYPLLNIFSLSFRPEGLWDLHSVRKLFTSTYYAGVLWFTFWQALVSTVLTVAFAISGAYVFARFRFPGKKLLQAFTTIPFVLPTIVVAAAFQALLGQQGLVNSLIMRLFQIDEAPIQMDYSVLFIFLAHVFCNYTVVLRIVGGFWSQLEPQLFEAAKVLGASPRQVFFKVTFPLLRPAIFASALLVFIFCFSSFGIVLILGGPSLSTIEVEIYRQAVHIFNLPMAAALSLIQILFIFGVMWIYTSLQRKTSVILNPDSIQHTQSKPSNLREKFLVSFNILFIVLLLGTPLLALILRSFTTENGFSFIFYRALFDNPLDSLFFVPPLEAILYSCGFALVTLLFSLSLGLLASHFLSASKGRAGAVLDPIFMLPLSTSAVTLGFGFIITLDEPPLNLRTSILLIPLAHTLVAFPFVVRCLLPALRSIPKSLKESATLLGATPFQAWKSVDLPIVGRALIVGAVFAFTVSLGEFGATVFTARPQTPTLPLAIYRFLGQPGALNYGQAMAMSSLLMLITASGFLFLEKLRVDSLGEF